MFGALLPQVSKSSISWPSHVQKPCCEAAPLQTATMEETDLKRRKIDFETIPKIESTSASRNLWSKRLTLYIDRFPKLRDLQGTLEQQYPGVVQFQLPNLDAVSGAVVRHTSTVLENLFQSQAPLTWKVGFTHSPLWRWGNKLYGYAFGKERFSHMLIMYISPEPYSAGMLEAAMIDKYRSTLFHYFQIQKL